MFGIIIYDMHLSFLLLFVQKWFFFMFSTACYSIIACNVFNSYFLILFWCSIELAKSFFRLIFKENKQL